MIVTDHQADSGLAYRLLCAANLAYGVSGEAEQTGTLEAMPPILHGQDIIEGLLDTVGFCPGQLHAHETPSRYGIDAFIYGETSDLAILAFRGTLPVRLTGRLVQLAGDWLNNTRMTMVGGEAFGLPGMIHEGFRESFGNLWDSPAGVASLLDRIGRAVAGGRRLMLTGHSKGGALAVLCALKLAGMADPNLRPAGVFTFGAPMTGNGEFASAFLSLFGHSAWRFEYQDDLVPHLPPSDSLWSTLRGAIIGVLDQPGGWSWPALAAETLALSMNGGYEPVGNLQFIDWHGCLRSDDSMALRRERWQRLSRTVVSELSEISRDHLPMQGYGYMDFLQARHCQAQR